MSHEGVTAVTTRPEWWSHRGPKSVDAARRLARDAGLDELVGIVGTNQGGARVEGIVLFTPSGPTPDRITAAQSTPARLGQMNRTTGTDAAGNQAPAGSGPDPGGHASQPSRATEARGETP